MAHAHLRQQPVKKCDKGNGQQNAADTAKKPLPQTLAGSLAPKGILQKRAHKTSLFQLRLYFKLEAARESAISILKESSILVKMNYIKFWKN